MFLWQVLMAFSKKSVTEWVVQLRIFICNVDGMMSWALSEWWNVVPSAEPEAWLVDWILMFHLQTDASLISQQNTVHQNNLGSDSLCSASHFVLENNQQNPQSWMKWKSKD